MNTIPKLYNEHPKTALFASAAALRLLLAVAFPALPDQLTLRAEISTPVNGFKRCTWGMDKERVATLKIGGQELRT
jgi:phosphatidylinositol glycan class U